MASNGTAVRSAQNQRTVAAVGPRKSNELDEILNDIFQDTEAESSLRERTLANTWGTREREFSSPQGCLSTQDDGGGQTVLTWQTSQEGPRKCVTVSKETVKRPGTTGRQDASFPPVRFTDERSLLDVVDGRRFPGPPSYQESRTLQTHTETKTRERMLSPVFRRPVIGDRPRVPPAPHHRRRVISPEMVTMDGGGTVHLSHSDIPSQGFPSSSTGPHKRSTGVSIHRNYASEGEEALTWLEEQRRKLELKRATGRIVNYHRQQQQQQQHDRSKSSTDFTRRGPGVPQSDTDDFVNPPKSGIPPHLKNSLSEDSLNRTQGKTRGGYSRTLEPPRFTKDYGGNFSRFKPVESRRRWDDDNRGRDDRFYDVSSIQRPSSATPHTKYSFTMPGPSSSQYDEFGRWARPAGLSAPTSPVIPARGISSRDAVVRSKGKASEWFAVRENAMTYDRLDDADQTLRKGIGVHLTAPLKPVPTEAERISLLPIGRGVQDLEPGGTSVDGGTLDFRRSTPTLNRTNQGGHASALRDSSSVFAPIQRPLASLTPAPPSGDSTTYQAERRIYSETVRGSLPGSGQLGYDVQQHGHVLSNAGQQQQATNRQLVTQQWLQQQQQPLSQQQQQQQQQFSQQEVQYRQQIQQQHQLQKQQEQQLLLQEQQRQLQLQEQQRQLQLQEEQRLLQLQQEQQRQLQLQEQQRQLQLQEEQRQLQLKLEQQRQLQLQQEQQMQLQLQQEQQRQLQLQEEQMQLQLQQEQQRQLQLQEEQRLLQLKLEQQRQLQLQEQQRQLQLQEEQRLLQLQQEQQRQLQIQEQQRQLQLQEQQRQLQLQEEQRLLQLQQEQQRQLQIQEQQRQLQEQQRQLELQQEQQRQLQLQEQQRQLQLQEQQKQLQLQDQQKLLQLQQEQQKQLQLQQEQQRQFQLKQDQQRQLQLHQEQQRQLQQKQQQFHSQTIQRMYVVEQKTESRHQPIASQTLDSRVGETSFSSSTQPLSQFAFRETSSFVEPHRSTISDAASVQVNSSTNQFTSEQRSAQLQGDSGDQTIEVSQAIAGHTAAAGQVGGIQVSGTQVGVSQVGGNQVSLNQVGGNLVGLNQTGGQVIEQRYVVERQVIGRGQTGSQASSINQAGVQGGINQVGLQQPTGGQVIEQRYIVEREVIGRGQGGEQRSTNLSAGQGDIHANQTGGQVTHAVGTGQGGYQAAYQGGTQTGTLQASHQQGNTYKTVEKNSWVQSTGTQEAGTGHREQQGVRFGGADVESKVLSGTGGFSERVEVMSAERDRQQQQQQQQQHQQQHQQQQQQQQHQQQQQQQHQHQQQQQSYGYEFQQTGEQGSDGSSVWTMQRGGTNDGRSISAAAAASHQGIGSINPGGSWTLRPDVSRSGGHQRNASGSYVNAPRFSLSGTRTASDTCITDGAVWSHQPPRFVRDTSKYWHKPNISREDAIGLLLDKEPGSFVVRSSSTFPGSFGLALKVSQVPPNMQTKGGDPQIDLIRHFLIEPTPKGVRLKGCSNEPVFASLAALIYQHSVTPLSLPCKLKLPDEDIDALDSSASLSGPDSQSNGAACTVLYMGSVETENLTGPEALARSIKELFESGRPLPRSTIVQFKVTRDGITLTDNRRRIFFRRFYPIQTITFCGADPRDRRWTVKSEDITISGKAFGFVARKPGVARENACHVFLELDPTQPANVIVNFVTKVIIGQGQRLLQ